MSTFFQDLRYGARLLAKSPGFSFVAVLSLALGIGATTAIFSLMDKVMLRPLAVASPDRLVTIESHAGKNSSFSYPLYKDYRDRNDCFSGLIAFSAAPMSFNDGGESQRVSGELVSGNYFTTLGVEPALGRLLTEQDDRTPGAHPVAVLGYKFWQRRYGADPSVVGKTVSLNTNAFTVIGVTPSDFTGLARGESPEMYVPMMMEEQARPSWKGALDDRRMTWLEMMGRLKPGVTREQAANSLALVADRVAEENPGNVNREFVIGDGSKGIDYGVREIAGRLVWLMIAVGLVLLIACANIANLLLARAASRRKEIAIRLAVGAGRARLVRQLLTESVLLSLLGGVVGIVIALWLVDVLLAFKPSASFTLDVQLDRRVLGFSLGVSVLTGVVFGLAPAVQSARADLVSALKDDAAAGRGPRRYSLRNALVVAQVALSLVVLICAGLSLKSLQNLIAIDTGFDPARLLVMSLDVSMNGYDEARGKQFYSQLSERVSSLAGVESASVAGVVPLGGGGMRRSVRVEGYDPPPGAPPLNFDMNVVHPDYFRTMRMPILSGRGFNAQDVNGSERVVVINETVASRFWPGQDAVGKYLDFGRPGDPQLIRIVGVIKNTKYRQLTEEPLTAMYLPLEQFYRPGMSLHVRTAADPKTMVAAIRHEVAQMDPMLAVYNIRTLEEQKISSLYSSRMVATLLGGFGVLALALAGVGIYGVMAYSVNRRTREIGIRMALGADSSRVLRLVMGEGFALVLVGLALGLGLTFVATRFISSMLYGVGATDPVTFAVIAALLATIALLACYLPARRATKVDPMIALRRE